MSRMIFNPHLNLNIHFRDRTVTQCSQMCFNKYNCNSVTGKEKKSCEKFPKSNCFSWTILHPSENVVKICSTNLAKRQLKRWTETETEAKVTTRWAKKLATLLLSITSPIID